MCIYMNKLYAIHLDMYMSIDVYAHVFAPPCTCLF